MGQSWHYLLAVGGGGRDLKHSMGLRGRGDRRAKGILHLVSIAFETTAFCSSMFIDLMTIVHMRCCH